jgi:hypothetical protein
VPVRSFSALLAAVAVFPVPGLAQETTVRVRVEENFRVAPQGEILGRVQPGVTLSVVSLQDSWAQVELEGWMWTPSLLATTQGGFDLRIGVEGGENLRDAPQGELRARLVRGTLLERVEEIEGWHRVRRVGWIWRESVQVRAGAASTTPVRTAPASIPEGWWRSGQGGSAILSGPDGDTLARSSSGTELEVLSRQGSWARVRLEGWIWAPVGETPSDSTGAPPLTEATPGEVTRNPDAYRGRVVSWELQFVSLERAERVRTDFYEGEPFLLARSVPDNTFVYVAVPPERLLEVEGLIPLERLRIVGRIRTGSAALTGNPILDLLDLTRTGRN